MKQKWSKEEEEILKRVYPRADIPREEIIKVFQNRSWNSIQTHAVELRIKRGLNGVVDKTQLGRLEKVYKI